MSADCMNPLLDHYILNQQSGCPPSLADENYLCLCAQSSFTSWYLSTLCINCDGAALQSPLSNLTTLCPIFTSAIQAQYPDGCGQYVGLSATTKLSSPSSSLTTVSSSFSETSSLSETTVVVTMTTPSPSSSSTKFSTLTASAVYSHLPTYPLTSVQSSLNATLLSTSPTSASPNATYASTSKPTPQLPLVDSSSSGMSTGAKAGIGVGAAAAAVGIGFLFISLLTILRRRNSRMKGSGYAGGYTGREIEGGDNSGGLGDTSTTLAYPYQGSHSQLNRSFGGSDRYGSSGLGITSLGVGPREKLGLVPSGRVREVRVGEDGEHRGSAVAMPLRAEGLREIHTSQGDEERTSVYPEDEGFGTQRESGVWNSAVEEQDPWARSAAQDSSSAQEDAGLEYSPARESVFRHDTDTRSPTAPARESIYAHPGPGTRHSTAHESNYEAAMRPKSRIYSVVDSPVLDLGQADLSREELERLEEEERRIDEAIRESESRPRMRVERGIGSIGKAL